jgi:hypothetical protein
LKTLFFYHKKDHGAMANVYSPQLQHELHSQLCYQTGDAVAALAFLPGFTFSAARLKVAGKT